jgi:quercetin 2,3-dioxygenase
VTDTENAPELFAGREVALGGSTVVRRLLPNLGRRLVGPWCFVDHYGPDDISSADGMEVPPHPHIGLQTVSWLLDGEVRHRDSIGSDTLISPGVLGLMTAGAGIAHAEHSPVPHPAMLHGVQLWVALPEQSRDIAPAWECHPTPVLTPPGLTVTVIMGELDGVRSPGTAYSPIVGLDLAVAADASSSITLEPDFEYAVLAMSGVAAVDGARVAPGAMLYLGSGRRELAVASGPGARLLLLGGEPFAEEIVMWWNFVARSSEEIAAARARWMDTEDFGTVTSAGDRTPAPELPPGRLKPGGARRGSPR